MFQFTTILLPTLDDIFAFFTSLRRDPLGVFYISIPKVCGVIARFIFGLLKIPYIMIKFWVVNGPTIFSRNYYELLEFALKTIPNEMRCYNKKRRFLAILEAWFIFFFFWKLLGSNSLAYVYALLKGITFALPLVSLTPTERMPLWGVALLVFAIDVSVMRAIWYSCCHGRNWKEVSRYKRITPNREFAFESTFVMYFVFKFLAFLSYYCYDSRRAITRVLYPHKPTRGGLVPDTDYFAALVEADTASNLRYGLLLILAVSSLTVYSIILAGWSSNSKYAFIGALRSAAQMISYEVAISLILLPVILLAGSLNLAKIVMAQAITVWFFFPLLPIAGLFLIAMLAETNRTPFDLPEAEAELVAGYNVDYSALPFAMFFLGEYCNMILISVLFCILFLGGWTFTLSVGHALLLSLKAAVIWVFFVIVRATLPRYRYDQLMDIGWKTFLPVTGGFLIFVVGLVVSFGAVPVVHELSHVNLFAAL
jgi:NADH:ubiquinone oxidoreductase subunit H